MNIEHDRNTAKRQLTVVTTVKDVIVPFCCRIVLEKINRVEKKKKKKSWILGKLAFVQ
jgi:hypothetical protein